MLNPVNLKPLFMKKLSLIITVLIISFIQLYPQKAKDVIYLKNGSKIFGKLLEADSSKYKFETSDGSIFIYDQHEVDKFSIETPVSQVRKGKSFIFSLETGLLVGPQNSSYPAPFSFDCQAGYLYNNRKTSVSIGSGVVFIGRPFTPLLLELRQNFSESSTSPYIFTRAGGIIPIGSYTPDEINEYPYYYSEYNTPKDYAGGASFALGTGISWAYEDYELNLSFAYRYAHYSYKMKEYNTGDVTYKENLNRLELKIGFRF